MSVARKPDIKQVDDVATAHGLTGPLRAAFGEAVEDAKTARIYPVEKGKLSWEHLNEIAEEFKVDHDIA
jgi:hypothetical protein